MRTETVILGAGVTGLAAGAVLKSSAIIIEKQDRPGGLVRSYCFDGGYWFDHVLHLLHFSDDNIMREMKSLMSDILEPCPPEAWIITKAGKLKYPFQFNLGALKEEDRDNCLSDFAKAYFSPQQTIPDNYKTYLASTFGESMCDLFYYPYNEKLYKYPLEKISGGNLIWNLHRPSFKEVLSGAFHPNLPTKTYNSNAYYPCPPKNAPLRGMELLSKALADQAGKIDFHTEIYKIDPPNKTVYAQKNGATVLYQYETHCLSTLPLPQLITMCTNAPESLKTDVKQLQYANVLSVGLSIKGARPKNPGLWQYYPDPKIPFTRLIFMTEFDALAAPEDGWSLLAEVTVNAKNPSISNKQAEELVVKAIKNINLLPENSEIIGVHSWIASPAYVIFTDETNEIIIKCEEFLSQNKIETLGRYGRWEYSSMSKNIKDGYDWARSL